MALAVRFVARYWKTAFAGLGLLAGQLFAANDEEPEPLSTVRVEDQVILQVSGGNMMLTEKIVIRATEAKSGNARPDTTHLVHVLIPPVWIKNADVDRPAFAEVRPYINISNGKVRRFVLTRPDGETLRGPGDQTLESRWLLTLDLGHLVPDRLTINVIMQQPFGIEPGTELLYTPSNDGQAIRSGPPATVQTDLRVKADISLEPWEVVQNEKVIERSDSSLVKIERNVPTRIRFGVKQ